MANDGLKRISQRNVYGVKPSPGPTAQAGGFQTAGEGSKRTTKVDRTGTKTFVVFFFLRGEKSPRGKAMATRWAAGPPGFGANEGMMR